VTLVVAGIDGGQSSTIAVIGDENGCILGRGTGGPADEIGVDADSTRMHDALLAALEDASRCAQLAHGSRFDAIVAGVSGYNDRVYGRLPQLPSERFIMMHDAPVAHAAALAGQPGVVIIAGTGSVVYTRDAAGSGLTLGGWGFLFGDEGSAFRIASDALAMLMRAQDDGDGSFADETRAACEFFAMPGLRQIGRAFYHGELARDRLASFAPAALRFERFRTIADRGADRLAALACRAIAAGAAARVGLAGGIFADAEFSQRLGDAIRATVPEADVERARYEPAAGALLLAYRELGIEVGELRE
jgi:N-acetylglucosamine kinase-like BadF-type ATPase